MKFPTDQRYGLFHSLRFNVLGAMSVGAATDPVYKEAMTRSYAAIAILLLASAGFSPAANACSCAQTPGELSVAEDDDIDFVAGGVPVAMEIADDGMTSIITFQIAESLKGQLDGTVLVHTPLSSAACGASFTLGADVRLAAYELDGQLWTGSCLQRVWENPVNSGLFETTFSDEAALPFDLCGRRIDGL